VPTVGFTGGEPTLLGEALTRTFRYIRASTGIACIRLVTNAMWATSYTAARRKLEQWHEAGLDELNISCGEFHQRVVPLARVVNAYRAAVDVGFRTVLLAGEFVPPRVATVSASDIEAAIGERLPDTAEHSPFTLRHHGLMRNCVMNYGRGETGVDTALLDYHDELTVGGTCSHVMASIALHPTGAVSACCGVMTRDNSALTIGNWRETPLAMIVDSGNSRPVLRCLRERGILELKKQVMSETPALSLRRRYTNKCDFCAELLYTPAAKTILDNLEAHHA
jgi:hypothetical protein